MKNRRENRKEKRERNRKRVSNPATLGPSVTLYDPHGSQGEPILVVVRRVMCGSVECFGRSTEVLEISCERSMFGLIKDHEKRGNMEVRK